MCLPANSPICKKWEAVGGVDVMGIALGTPELILDGKTTLQRFEKGAICLTNSYGVSYLSKEVFAIWEGLKGRPSVGNVLIDLQTFLGCPVSDTFPAPQNSEACYFERGMIFFKDEPAQGEFGGPRKCVVYGKNFDKYMATGGLKGPLGLPTKDTLFDPAGFTTSRFDNGMICSQAQVGVGVMFSDSPIFSRWNEIIVGSKFTSLGCPITDEQAVMKDGAEVGRFQRFKLGEIYWSQNTGAFDVRGEILSTWKATYGGPAGELGFPVSNHGLAPKSNKIFNNFQNGILVFDRDDPASGVLKAKSLEYFVQRFAGTGGDEALSSGLEVYVNASVGSNLNPVVFNGRLPDSGFYAAEEDVNLAFAIPGVVNDKTVASFDFEGKDHDDVGEDGTLGRVIHVYDIDNLWGLRKGLALEEDDAFHVTCGCREAGGVIDSTQPFRWQSFWSFENFSTDELSQEQYAATFSDIDAGTLLTINPATWIDEVWEAIFYRVVYKDMADKGNCFGMCAESLYAQVGRSFFTEPIFKYKGTEGGLVNEINIKHGYQCGASVVDWFVAEFLTGITHDPSIVFLASRAVFEAGDCPIISMSNSYFKAGGHVVQPYNWDASDPDLWKIFIANPNFPPNKAGFLADDVEGCIIHVDPGGQSFSFQMKAGDVWTGSEWVGGRMHFIPYSQLDETPRTPGHEILALLGAGGIIICGSAGQTLQISDQAGRTVFEPDLINRPEKWEEIRRDGDSLLGSVSLMPFFSGNGRPVPELYFVRDTGATLQHRIAPRIETPPDDPYYWLMRSPTLSAAIALQAASSPEDSITVERAAGLDQTVSVSLSPEGSGRKAEMWLCGWRGFDHEHDYSFRLHDLSLAPGQTIASNLDQGGRELLVKNDGPQVTCSVTVRGTSTRQVVLNAGETTRITPNWMQLDQPWLVEKAQPSLRRFMESRGLMPELGVLHYFPSVQSLRDLLHA